MESSQNTEQKNAVSAQSLTESIPVIDMEAFLKDGSSADAKEQCRIVAECFHKYGILLVKDPRVNEKDNDDYIDLMEDYFEQAGDRFYKGEKVDDIKPEYHYQVGATPENIELPRDHSEKRAKLEIAKEDLPQSPMTPIYDAKWRFMWKIGERPENAADDFPQVLPAEFPDWETKMNTWGTKLNQAVFTIAEMAAVGMNIPNDTFTKRMIGGAHLLAPTGSDLKKNDIGAVFAGFHYDISFMTIHGKSRYPGLAVWTRDWKKYSVKIPQGCLLVQAGLTFEHITGGYVLGGFHEVIYTEGTKAAYERKQAALAAEGKERT